MTAGNASVPFLDFKSFIAEEAEAQEPEVEQHPPFVRRSFRSTNRRRVRVP